MAEDEALDAAATVGDSAVDIEAQIKSAMVARTPYFEKQADSLTFEGVRRLIEKDLGMEKHALDVHKRLIKNCLQECLDGSETADASNSTKEIEQNVITSDKSDPVESAEVVEPKKETVESVSENEDKMEDSPVMGLLTTQNITKSDTKGTEGNGNKGDLTESTILKAIKKRAAYFRSNAEKVTMGGVRRLLEEDLELEKCALDPFKQFIGKELEKVLEAPEVSKSAKPKKEKTVKKLSKTKASKEEVSDGSGADSSASEEEEVKPRKKTPAKGKTATDAVKKRKTPPSKEAKTPSKRIKPEKATSNSSEDKEDREHGSGDESQSSGEKHSKKKEVSAPVYGKRVERLKSIIKACGMGVPPSIYKKVKQGPEDKREARLIKELEEILSKEGLSANPSEKEIKDVKRKKERARELEGIDTSNIVSSSRRRSTSSYVPPPKPKIAVESEGEESEESEEDEDDEEDEEVDVNNDDDDENNDGNDESQGEDASEGEEESE